MTSIKQYAGALNDDLEGGVRGDLDSPRQIKKIALISDFLV